MVQRTIVSIYEVDEWSATGPWVSQGSLVYSSLVVVHPPLSNQIATGKGPARTRVGILPGEGAPVSQEFSEVIDVWGKPRVLWVEDDLSIVVLELRRPALSPVYEIPGVDWTKPQEDNFRVAAIHLKEISSKDWFLPVKMHNAFWCKLIPGICKH